MMILKNTLALTAAMFLGLSLASAVPEIGKPAPNFKVQGADGKTHSLDEYKGKFVILEWTNKDCPFVQGLYMSDKMQETQRKLTGQGAVWLSVISSAPGSQGAVTADEAKANVVQVKASPTEVLLDSEGKVGKAYEAKTTPHMFVVNPKGDLVYMGAIDDAKAANKGENYVVEAFEEAKAGKPVTTPVTKSYGCGVKY